MLKQLKIKNLKSIGDADLRLAPLTILTGANSSGKSTVIQALMLLIKNSGSVNRFSMDELLRFLDNFSAIRNKKENARTINITAVDTADIEHNIEIKNDGVVAKTTLPYQFESTYDAADVDFLYLNANRLGAEELVAVSQNRKVGDFGQYLFSHFDKIKGNPLPDNLVKFDGSKTLGFQISQWLTKITDSDLELKTEAVGDYINVSFRVKDLNSEVSPFNLGSGISYIAKVLIICLMAKKGDLVVIENPEVQLHPKSQALLGTFLAFIANNNIQLIVETHSEHLINKIAYEVYEDHISNNDIVIHYKKNVDQNFETILFDENGEFNNINGEIISFLRVFLTLRLLI
ncbi:AAA family ATPase [Photobacterium leiognathi]|uniref:AAA family ATPase n=1 Tax=Photobacterium leiognathi TaxID=553611 RepID=UPI00069833EA|nr:AAA family ATPase [Photobacterium leiognathi]